MRQLEEKYKRILNEIRDDFSLLHQYDYESATDGTGNQTARQRLLASLLNFKRSGDYAIASYLFDEELKAKHQFTTIEDYYTDILELSALVLISFGNVKDILKMVEDRPNLDGELAFVDPVLFLLYGKENCLNFLKSSTHPNAALALDKLSKIDFEFNEEDVKILQKNYDEYFSSLRFPLTSVIDFCINMNETEILDQEAVGWINTIEEWDEFELTKGLSILRLIDNPTFASKMASIKEQFLKKHEAASKISEKENKEDESISKSTNILAIIFFVLLAIGFTSLSLIAAALSGLQEERFIDRLPYYGVSLVVMLLASLSWKGVAITNLNDLNFFKKVYLSGERKPQIEWVYTSNTWNTFAQEKYKKMVRNQFLIISTLVLIAIILSIIFYNILLVTMICWAFSLGIVIYLVNGYKNYENKKSAYLHTRPAIVQFYDKGLVIGKKHYEPYNTRYMWLLGFEVEEKDGQAFLKIKRNARAGEHPEHNINYLTIPIPKGKEEEAKHFSIG